MKIVKSWGMRLLAAFLILLALHYLIELKFQGLPIVQGILAAAAGVLILLEK